MRVTKKYLTNWINAKMKELEISFEVKDIQHTRLRGQDYEDGAAMYVVVMQNETRTYGAPTYYIYFTMKQIEYHIQNGWSLYFKPRRIGNSYILQDAEIGLTKN